MFKKKKIAHIFDNLFGFEKGIDVTDDVAVLFRKNVVIKNIVLLSNLIYTIIFMVVSLGERSNWFLTVLCIPITFLVNHTLKKMIYKDKENYLRQQIAMYICCFYMFLSAILIYTRLKVGLETDYFGEVGYILLYYSLVICSFYQSKKLLKTVYPWVIVLLTVIHFSITYNLIFNQEVVVNDNFFKLFFTSNEFKDILLRTFILLIFMLVLYVSVSVSDTLAEERKKELVKRQEVEKNYTDVVLDLFKLTLDNRPKTNKEISEGILLGQMSHKLALLLGYSLAEASELREYSQIHLISKVDLNIDDSLPNELKFNKLKEETKLGSLVLKREQLARKTEDIIRANLEGANTEEFMAKMKSYENDLKSQIVMLCDMYISLRSVKTYKRAINHNNTLDLLKNSYRIYYDQIIFERFVKFADEFREMFDNYKEEL